MKKSEIVRRIRANDPTLNHKELCDAVIELAGKLDRIRKIAEAQMREEEIGDVKYVMREFDEIIVLAGGKRTNAW